MKWFAVKDGEKIELQYNGECAIEARRKYATNVQPPFDIQLELASFEEISNWRFMGNAASDLQAFNAMYEFLKNSSSMEQCKIILRKITYEGMGLEESYHETMIDWSMPTWQNQLLNVIIA